MTQTNQLIDNQFATLTDEELTHVNGGVAPLSSTEDASLLV